MSVGVVVPGPFDDRPPDRGVWLAEHRFEMDRGECSWLVELGWFDREGGWGLDGQSSTVTWLRWRTDLARPTAFEKVRVARVLLARDRLREAFEGGRVSYSAVRVISRLDGLDPATEEALVRVAEVGSVDDVELAVRTYRAFVDQEVPPDERWGRRGFGVGTPVEGLVRVEGTFTETEADEINVALDAFADRLWRSRPQAGESPDGDHPDLDADIVDDGGAESAGESPRGDHHDPDGDSAVDGEGRVVGSGESPGGDDPGRRRVSRADAYMAMVRTAMAHLADTNRLGGVVPVAVNYVHHADSDTVTRMDGSPVTPSLAGAACCDAATIDHLVGDNGEPLRLGRKTRQWSTAQRRAISVRDGGRCRFPGCNHRMTQIHHVHHWNQGGPTDVDNGALLCPRHHALHHAGFVIEGQPDGTLSFARPDGTPIGTTHPRCGGQLPL